ncbi:Sensor histidine kinase RcsC [Pandoraea iniqua]|uniref:histidine kinase n=1 Tax=Pandoraea iniqua TaxID=2508288 RepID=A0A5E4YCU6_9BURK|nr:ATP-binding protein [Pandoraea iniqua]VVE46282.1 Sensor histidine kinase RcsC [Pandoraea iniqua]
MVCIWGGLGVLSWVFDPSAAKRQQTDLGGTGMHDEAISRSLVELLYRNVWGVVISNVATALAAVFVLGRAVALDSLLIWFAAVCVLCSARVVAALCFSRFRHAGRGVKLWERLAVGFSWASGALWGILGWMGFILTDPLVFSFTMVVLSGIVCGTVPALSACPPALVGSILATTVPLGIRCVIHGGETVEPFLFLLFTLVGINFYYCRSTYRMLRRTIFLRLQNEALAGHLAQERDRAQSANQSKTRFLAAASHDLRQPIYALSLLVTRLARLGGRGNVAAGDALDLAGHAQSLVDDLGGLLNGLLDISKLDAGVVVPKRQAISVMKLFREIEVEFSMEAYHRELDWRVVGIDLELESDPMMLKRILNNLLSNAFRYTANGGVLLGCRRRADALEIQIWDTGPGIASEHQALIFEEFLQLQNPQRDRSQGLGLGLAIVKRTAALLGHPIRVDSVPGRGAMFSVTVPMATPESRRSDASRSSVPHKRSLGVVVIDDEAQVLDALEGLLRLEGHRVYAGKSAQAAIAQHLASGGEERSVDLILADYRLGTAASGMGAIDEMRDYLRQDVPALIVTGDTAPESLQRITSMGVQVLHKPVDGEDLLKTIEWIAASSL